MRLLSVTSAGVLPAVAAAFGLAAPASVDTIVVRFGAGIATVTQRLAPHDGVVEAHAMRLAGQWLYIERTASRGPVSGQGLEPLPGAYHLRLTGEAPVDLQYRVAGRLDRVPLFVAPPDAQLASTPVTLRVELPSDSPQRLDLATSLPRLSRTSEGTLTATLPSTPSFVRLDAAGGLSFARAADLAVVLLILTAAVWAWRTARRSNPLARPGSSA